VCVLDINTYWKKDPVNFMFMEMFDQQDPLQLKKCCTLN